MRHATSAASARHRQSTSTPFSRCISRVRACSAALRVVRDHDDRLAELAVQPVEQAQDLLAGRAVEVAGRLVGDDQRRVGDDRARDRDALLLAAGELVRIVVHAVGQARRASSAASHVLAPLARATARVSSSGSSTFSNAVSTGIRL